MVTVNEESKVQGGIEPNGSSRPKKDPRSHPPTLITSVLGSAQDYFREHVVSRDQYQKLGDSASFHWLFSLDSCNVNSNLVWVV